MNVRITTRRRRAITGSIIALVGLVAGFLLSTSFSAAAGTTAFAMQSSGAARSIWDDTTLPGETSTPVDSNAVELGVKFRATESGFPPLH